MSSPVDEALYRELMAPHVTRWRSRAAKPGQKETVVSYAVRRAGACERRYVARLAGCGRRGIRVRCGCRGWRGVRAWTCRQHLACASCRAARAKRLGARIRAGLDAALRARPGEMLVLLTMTVRHSGDVGADRRELATGWREFYRRLRRRYPRFAYVGVWEVTPGRDGQGHVHLHVAAVWPWRDWSLCSRLWRESCPASTRISFVARRRDRRPSDPRSVANYLSKYLTKGIEGEEFTEELRTRVIASMYNARWVLSSLGFWQLFIPCCPECGQPRVVAQYRWHGAPYRPPVERGPPLQYELHWSTEQRLHG